MAQMSHTQSLKQFLNLGTRIRDTSIVEAKLREKTHNEDIINVVIDYYLLLTHTTFLRNEMYDFYVLNLSYKKIAKKYDIKLSSIRNIIYRETKRIQDVLGGYDVYQMWLDNSFTKTNIGILQVIIESTVNKPTISEKNFTEEYEKINTISKTTSVTNEEKPHPHKKKLFLEGKLCVNPSNIVNDRQFNTQVNDAQFTQLLKVIHALSEKNQQKLVNKYDSRLWGYIDYLYAMPNNSLTSTDKERKLVLVETLKQLDTDNT